MSLLKIPLQQFNPHILCVLCGGYLVDATTVIECLHSFCRSCIVKYLQTSFHCPVCDVEVHKTKPLLHIRPDRPLQEIVNKLVPGLVYDELGRRQKFEENLNKENTENEGVSEDISGEKNSTSRNSSEVEMEDPVYITLEYYRRKRNWNEKQVFPTRYLRCPSAITVRVLKKFLIMKFAIPNTHKAELVRSDELLSDSLTMKELSQIYGLYTKSFLDLQYSFLDFHDDKATEDEKKETEPPKKLKKSETKHTKYELTANVDLKQAGTPSKNTLESNSDYVNLNYTLDRQAFQRDFISTSFPETPPSFECDEMKENKGHVTTF